MHGCSELFSLGLPYLPRGADLQGKGKQRRLGGDRSVGPADKGGSKEGKGKRIAQALGELGARLQGGRKDHDRQTDEDEADQAQQ